MYGPGSGPMREDTPHRAVGTKGPFHSQMIADLLAAHDRGELRAVVVRASDFCRPEVTESEFGDRLLPKILAGKYPQLMGRPDAHHSLSYIGDVARALVDAGADPSAWGRVWHGPVAPTRALAEMVSLNQRTAGVNTKNGQYTGRGLLTVAGVFVP